MDKKALLIILDGWGHGQKRRADAIALAHTPFMQKLYRQYPSSELVTFGEDVGLPEGQMGNSEVGHLNIGAGRVVYQELTRINKAIRENTLSANETLIAALKFAKDNNKPVHFIGLVSDGGVHSHINHLKTLVRLATDNGCKGFVHAFTDGRDCDPKSGARFIGDLIENLKTTNFQLADVVGRYYAMDRDNRWERVKLAYDLLVNGVGEKSDDIVKTLNDSYAAGITDEFIKPIVLDVGRRTSDVGNNISPTSNVQRPTSATESRIKSGDVVIFFNFRTDRPRELTQVLSQTDMPDFGMKKLNLYFVTMTRYDEKYIGVKVIFENDNLTNTIGEVVADAGLTQVRIAETEKYPHVTFFFSGGREAAFKNEKRIMIPSPKVATYDLQPEMSALTVTDAIITEIDTEQPNFIALNFANTDMVGHTGILDAAIKAAETVSICVERLVNKALSFDYEIIIIADHGNSDYMINEDGTPNTQHTLNPVPCIYVSKNARNKTLKNGRLADIAPTLLYLLGVAPAKEMTGENLISSK